MFFIYILSFVVHVRGALRIYAKLHRKGVKHSESEINNPMSAEVIFAAPLVKWTQVNYTMNYISQLSIYD